MNKEMLIKVLKVLNELIENLQGVIGNVVDVSEIIHSMCETANESKSSNERKITLEDVRKVLAGKSQAGFRDEVKNLISKYDASKLSDVKPEKYEELLKEAEELGNG